MKTVQLNSLTIIALIPVLIAMINIVPEKWIDGPFNHKVDPGNFFNDADIVPNTMYANNGSGLVTYWDEDIENYRTWDQINNRHMDKVVFNIDSPGEQGQHYLVAGNRIVPLTQLDNEELQIQSEQGCTACHPK